jgi:serine-type D-Ala-D-Ala carboxypeptidase (penicillin-binding protein 5/6)
MRPALRLAAAVSAAACVVPAAQLSGLASARASPVAGHASHPAAPAGVVAAAGELVNATSGKWMWSRGLDTRHPIASLTKVMTALVVLSDGDLNRKIKVTEAAVQYAAANSAGSAGLHVGDVMTAWQLLEGMLLPSGADAAYLLAHSYGPGWPAFVRRMNATARKLGMTQTHFANFDGLPWPTPDATYSSPRDLIIMGEAAMKLPDFRKIVSQRSHSIGATSQHHHYYWKNTDLLLTRYHGAIGIKTGYTTAAGYCLLFEARRGGRELMGVVLDSTSTDTTMRFTAAARLLNWGFAAG